MLGGEAQNPVRVIGRYALYGELASGGMATVHIGRLLGPVGFARTVAIKRLHPQFAKDPEFVSMFLDEARLAARIQHPNVCDTLDVVATQGELFLVLEYLQGETLSRILRSVRAHEGMVDPRIAVTILAQTLHGLHAAHEARNERGEALQIVHRDISPQNVLVGRDGVSKVLDFGVAKAAGRFHTTREGNVKGKLPYMSPEQLRGEAVDRQTDIYAAAVCLWETLAGRRLFHGDNEGSVLQQVMNGAVEPPSTLAPGVPEVLDTLVMRGLERDKSKRFATAREFAIALERAVQPALASDVGDWVESIAGDVLTERAERIAEIESVTDSVPLGGLTEVMSGLHTGGGAPLPAPPSSGMIGGSSSQVSSISVAQGDPPFIERPRKGLVIAGGALAVAALIGTFVVVRAATEKSPAPSTPASAPSTPVAAAPSTGPTDDPGRQVPPIPVVSATASVTAHIAAPTSTQVHAVHPPGTTTAGAAKGDDCKIPYTLGPNGEKIYKRQCF